MMLARRVLSAEVDHNPCPQPQRPLFPELPTPSPACHSSCDRTSTQKHSGWPLGSWSHIKYKRDSWKTPELERPSVLSRGNRKSTLTLGSAGHTEGLCHAEKAQEQRAAMTDARHSVCTPRGMTVSHECELLGTGTMSYSPLLCCAQHVQAFNE